jgi:arylsulfatase A-like enzyme
VPLIAWWPGKIEANSVSGHISGFQDFLPTACELAGTTPQEATDGLSYLPTLMGKRDQQVRHEWLYWEFLFMPNMKKKPDAKPTGRQAILNPGLGFKAVRFGRHSPVELYRFEEDTSEINDMAGRYPDIAEQMTKYLNACRSESELWPIRFHDIPLVSTFSPHYETDKGKRNSTRK